MENIQLFRIEAWTAKNYGRRTASGSKEVLSAKNKMFYGDRKFIVRALTLGRFFTYSKKVIL